MREILFRGKRIYNDEWVEGSLVHETDYYGDPVDRYHIVTGGSFHCDYYDSDIVAPETVGQFTGYTDKNGKKIFEGDIVRHGFGKYTSYTHVVEWVDESCGFEPFSDSRENCGHCGGGVNPDIEDCYVIGNIHDNPELLEAKDA